MGFALMIGGASTLFLTFGLSINAETMFLFVSRCFVLCAFTVLYIFTPEAYPTSSRSMGLGLNNAFSRMGGMIAPFIAIDLPEAVSCHNLHHLDEQPLREKSSKDSMWRGSG